MKKALSFILALTLALTLLPTFAYASTTEETPYNWEPIVFDFAKPTDSESIEATSTRKITGNSMFYGRNWFGWNTPASSDIFDHRINEDPANSYVQYIPGSSYSTIVVDKGYIDKKWNTYAISLNVPTSGIYDIFANVYNFI